MAAALESGSNGRTQLGTENTARRRAKKRPLFVRVRVYRASQELARERGIHLDLSRRNAGPADLRWENRDAISPTKLPAD
jgi:hypothetical protein